MFRPSTMAARPLRPLAPLVRVVCSEALDHTATPMKLGSKYFDSIRAAPKRAAEEKSASRHPPCQWKGCEKPGPHKAPAGRGKEGQYYNFCLDHVRHYNAGYNYFDGMNDAEVDEFRKDALTGHREAFLDGGLTIRSLFRSILDDPRYATNAARAQNQDTLVPMIQEWLLSFADNESLLQTCLDHRIPIGPVLTPMDAVGHPHFEARDMVRMVPDPVLGEVMIPGYPFKFSAQPDLPDLRAPLLGQHNRSVLTGVLGYDPERVAALESRGVLYATDR